MELLFPLLLLLPLLLLIMRQRKQQRVFAEQQGRVGVGMTVMTTGGLYGTVFDIEDDVVVLEVDEGVYLRFSRLAIGRIVDDAGQHPGPEVGLGATVPHGEPSPVHGHAGQSGEADRTGGAPSVAQVPAHDPPTPAPDQVDIRKGAGRSTPSTDGV